MTIVLFNCFLREALISKETNEEVQLLQTHNTRVDEMAKFQQT